MTNKPQKPATKHRAKQAAKLSVWEPTLRVGYVIVVAVFVALVAGRVNRGQQVELAGTEPAIDPVLLQPVKTVDLNLQSIRWAVESLNKASPVRVELDAESFAGELERDTPGDGPPPRSLRLKGQTVAEAVAAILARFDRPDRPLTFIVENGWVILGRADRLATREGSLTRAYDVGDLLDRESAGPLESQPASQTLRVQRPQDSPADASVRLAALIAEVADPGAWNKAKGIKGVYSARVARRWLIVEATPRAQRDVQRALFILRHGEVVRGAATPSRRSTSPTSKASTPPANVPVSAP